MGPLVQNNSIKLDEVLRRLEHIESLLLMGEVFPDNEEIEIIKDYISKTGHGETDFISLEEIDNEL